MRRQIARISPLALIALIPAAVNATTLARPGTIDVPICTGDGSIRTVQMPLNGQPQRPGGDSPCCAKGCHTGSSRKRIAAR